MSLKFGRIRGNGGWKFVLNSIICLLSAKDCLFKHVGREYEIPLGLWFNTKVLQTGFMVATPLSL